MSAIPDFFAGAVLVNTGERLPVIGDLEVPDLREGQVLVRLRYSGLCHSQLMEARGARGVDRYLTHLLGHEGSGVVVAFGPGVSKVRVGDEVVVGWIKGTGLEGGSKTYNSASMGMINAGPVTTLSEYTVVSENRVYLKPENTPPDLAVLYGCALPTGVGLVYNEIKPKIGASIAVVGCGGIGLSAMMAAKGFQPRCLVAVDREEHKRVLATKLGSSLALHPDQKDFSKQVFDHVGSNEFDYVIEAAGLVSTIEFGFSLVRKNGGELIFASHPRAGEKIKIDPFDLICGKTIRGSWGGASKPDEDIVIMDQLYTSGALDLEALISHRYSLHDINDALDDLENRKIVRALFEFETAKDV
jgi:S-(hydroxymethyl)glutathione dehydrogenase/alcohol dehydrogenase